MDNKKSILASLDQLWSLEPQLLAQLRRAAERASEQNLKKIAAVVAAALEKQDALVKKLVKADPQFPAKLRQFLHDRFLETRGTVKAGEQTNIDTIMEKIESS